MSAFLQTGFQHMPCPLFNPLVPPLCSSAQLWASPCSSPSGKRKWFYVYKQINYCVNRLSSQSQSQAQSFPALWKMPARGPRNNNFLSVGTFPRTHVRECMSSRILVSLGICFCALLHLIPFCRGPQTSWHLM